MFRILLLFMAFCLMSGFIPPSGWLVKKATEKNSSIQKAKLELIYEIMGGSEEERTVVETFSEELYYRFPSGFVYQIRKAGSQDIFCRERVSRGKKEKFGLFYDLFFSQNLPRIIMNLKAHNLPILDDAQAYETDPEGKLKLVREPALGLGRTENGFAYIIGGDEKKSEGTQLWLSKGNIFPVKYKKMVADKEYEIVFRQYRKFGEAIFPGIIEMSRDGLLVLRIRINKIDMATKVASEFTNRTVSACSFDDSIKEFFSLMR